MPISTDDLLPITAVVFIAAYLLHKILQANREAGRAYQRPEETSPAATKDADSTLLLSPLEIYTWALQGPFEDGHESALTMAKIIYITRGEERLNTLKSGIVSHEKNYNKRISEWEAWRKYFIKENLSNVGEKKSESIKKIEKEAKQLDTENYCIQKIARLLKSFNYEINKNKAEPDPDNLKKESWRDHREAFKPHFPSRQASHKERAPTDESKDIFDKTKEKFIGAAAVLSIVIYAGIFFASWGALIASNLILGLAFGWIPAFIVTFIASIFAPLVMLISGLIILSLIALAIFIAYNVLI